MELPAEVMVHNELMGMKGSRATLLQISPDGYYELNLRLPSGDVHRVLLPIRATVVMATEPEEARVAPSDEIER
jgi:hypothetical protein